MTYRWHDVMTASTTAITLRLSPEDHKLLQLPCLVTGKSQNRLMTELLAAEIDRVLPGKRDAMRQPGSTLERLYAAIGTTPPADRRPRPSIGPAASSTACVKITRTGAAGGVRPLIFDDTALIALFHGNAHAGRLWFWAEREAVTVVLPATAISRQTGSYQRSPVMRSYAST